MTTERRPTGYTVGSHTGEPSNLPEFLKRELGRVSASVNELAARAPQYCTAPPSDPRVGMVVYAASPWNPGSGNGTYTYTPTGWVLLSIGTSSPVTSVNGNTGAVVLTAASLGAITAEADTLQSVTARGATTTLDLALNSTGALTLPTGTTAQRPGAPTGRMLRHNSTRAAPELYDASISVWRSMTDLGWTSVKDHGATGDGTTDDRAAFQAALNTGLDVAIPRGSYRLSGSISFVKANQKLYGFGPNSVNGTKLSFDSGVTQFVICDSTAAAVTLNNCEIANVLLLSAVYSGSTAIALNKASGFAATDVTIQTVNRGFDSFGSRGTTWTRCTISAMRSGGWCGRLKGTSTDPGGIANFYECRWDCIETGAGPAALGQEADGLVIEGAVATVTTYSLQIVRARRAYATIAGSEGAGINLNPSFLYNYDFQSDSTGENGIRSDYATDLVFDRGWIQGCYFGSGVLINNLTTKFRFRGYVGGASENGFDIAGTQIVLDSISCGRNSVVRIASGTFASPGAGTRDNVVIRSTAQDVSILGGAIGTTENGTGIARYNVNIELGATRIRVVGVDLNGSLTAPVNDLSGGETQIIACPGQTERISARGTGLLELGNQGSYQLRVGNTVAGTLVNSFRVSGAATGSAPQLLVEGDTNTGMILSTKGTGVGRLRHDATDALLWDTNRVDSVKPLRLPSFTVATLPSAATHARSLIYVSDGTASKRLAISDGSSWRWPDGVVVS